MMSHMVVLGLRSVGGSSSNSEGSRVGDYLLGHGHEVNGFFVRSRIFRMYRMFRIVGFACFQFGGVRARFGRRLGVVGSLGVGALVVEAALEQFSAGGYAVVGLEALVFSESVHGRRRRAL